MGAFQSGFNMGRVMYQQALDNRDREQQRREQAEERALRLRSLQLGVEGQEDAARRQRDAVRMQQGISDFISGVDRPATAAALDADFEQAQAASESSVKAENVARQSPTKGYYGIGIRRDLHPGEDEFFRKNPTVAGMAADDDRIILNPYSTLSGREREAVIMNEAARVHMRRNPDKPTFTLTPEQQTRFANYSQNPDDVRATVAARILSGDPSAGTATPEQMEYVQRLRQSLPAPPPAAPAMPAMRGASNAANEAALTARNPMDPASTVYRQGLNRLQAQLAASQGDMRALSTLDAEARAIAEDDFIAGRIKGYTGADDQVAQTRQWINQSSQRITLGAPDKNGLVRLSVVTPDGGAEFPKLNRSDQATLYAAVGLLERNPVRALQMMAGVNKTLAEAVAAENNLTGVLAQNTNSVADKTSAINERTAASARADEANDRANKAEGRAAAAAGRDAANAQQGKADMKARVDAAVALYRESNPNATPAQIEAVRTGVISAVPAEDKNAPAEVKLARAALAAKVPGVTSMSEALTWARSRATKAPDEVIADIYAAVLKRATSNKPEDARKAAEQARRDLYPDAPKAAPAVREASGATAPAPKPAPGAREASGSIGPAQVALPTQAQVHAEALDAIANKGADRNLVNQRLKSMGFAPLP